MIKTAARAAASLAAGLAMAGTAGAEGPALTVYTYASFTSEWGPGPAIETAFEERCGCDVRFVSVDDGVAILGRLKLEGEATRADVALGLDLNLVEEARATGLFAPHTLPLTGLDLPVAWADDTFVPFDWGYFAFVYDSERMAEPPQSLQALVEASDAEILIQDPRTSTPGLGLLLWMKTVLGDGAAAAWERLSPRVVTVSSGWSESYGLFLEGEAPMVLSYTTSPAYHRIVEGDDRYRAAPFAEGHYMQVEVAARLAASDQPDLAEDFLAFLLEDEVQELIPTTNWMYPAVMPEGGLPAGFEGLVEPAHALILPSAEVAANRPAWIAEWLEAMSRGG
jgi:thiamine transport system substrate-binding protein